MTHPLTVRTSPYSVQETADKLCRVLEAKNIRIFARIDHAEAARASALAMNEEQVIVFGDPKVGTNLMRECPPIGIELPLKILIWQSEQTWIGYREPKELLNDYTLVEHRGIVEKMSGLMASLVDEVIRAN